MHHDDPSMERRLLLAFGLTMLILAAWPALARRMGWAPPVQSINDSKTTSETATIPPQQANKSNILGINTPLNGQEDLVSRYLSTTSSKLGISGSTASLSQIEIKPPSYKTDPAELTLLSGHEGPGIGAVAWQAGAEGALSAWSGWALAPGTMDERHLTARGEVAPGVAVESRYDLDEEGRNALTMTVSVTNRAAIPYPIQPRLLAGRLLHDPLDRGRYRLLRASVAGKGQSVTVKAGAAAHRREGEVDWVTAQTKYYTTIVTPKTPAAALVITRDVMAQPQAWIEWPTTTIPPGETRTWVARGYAGPLDYRFLDALQLDQATSLGAFTTITRLLQTALNGLTRVFHNSHGTAIVVLTLLLSLLFYPLTWTSFRTMKKMERLQPEIKALQERYKNDPKRLNEEAMALYKQHRVNPLAGCLPLLLQMPIFISLYQVLSRSPELRGARFLLIKDLAAPDHLVPLPGTLPILGPALNVLPLAMAVMMFVQQRMSSSGRAVTEEQRVQQQVFAFMPILFGVMFYALPSGLVLYWLLNTTLTVVQQRLILRKLA